MEMDMQGCADMRREPAGSPRASWVRVLAKQKHAGPGRHDSAQVL